MTEPQSIQTDRIVQDPAILAGKPMIRGTRISFWSTSRTTRIVDELLADYPRLTMDDIKAALIAGS